MTQMHSSGVSYLVIICPNAYANLIKLKLDLVVVISNIAKILQHC